MTDSTRHEHGRRRRMRGVSASVAALVLVAAVAATAGCSPSEPVEAFVRVDQVGAVVGEGGPTAYALGSRAALADAGFLVRGAGGEVVLTGGLGAETAETAETGGWNERYDAVRTIDLGGADGDADDLPAGSYTIELTGTATGTSPRFEIGTADELLRPLAELTLRFFQAQRDGAEVLPEVMDREPAHLLDRAAAIVETPEYDGGELVGELVPRETDAVDVSGGWFDAGDFLKFTGTSAFTTAALLLAERDGGAAAHTGEAAAAEPVAADAPAAEALAAEALAAEAEFGLDWLDRMWLDDSQTLLLQVGIGAGNAEVRTDHDVWRLPEDDDANAAPAGDPDYWIAHRPVFTAGEPGGALPPSVAGRVAAAFALGAQRSARAGDEATARARLERAALVYELADTAPGADDNNTAIPAEFYPEDSWQDDLEFAAAELAVAARQLGDPRASSWRDDGMRWAREYTAADALGTLGVGDVSALAHAELLGLAANDGASESDAASANDGASGSDADTSLLLADLRRQLDGAVEHAASDPFRAGASTTDFDSAPFTFGLVATAALYERATGDDEHRAFAARQRGWVFGANAWGASFMIGAGTTYPQCPEHQVANLAGAGPLLGAVVNGPNAAEQLAELNGFDTMTPCSATAADGADYAAFDGRGARFVDDVGAWQTVEPALDFTATALLGLTYAATLP